MCPRFDWNMCSRPRPDLFQEDLPERKYKNPKSHRSCTTVFWCFLYRTQHHSQRILRMPRFLKEQIPLHQPRQKTNTQTIFKGVGHELPTSWIVEMLAWFWIMPRILLKISCVDPLNLRLLSKEEENESVRRKRKIGGKERKKDNKRKDRKERKHKRKGTQKKEEQSRKQKKEKHDPMSRLTGTLMGSRFRFTSFLLPHDSLNRTNNSFK